MSYIKTRKTLGLLKAGLGNECWRHSLIPYCSLKWEALVAAIELKSLVTWIKLFTTKDWAISEKTQNTLPFPRNCRQNKV